MEMDMNIDMNINTNIDTVSMNTPTKKIRELTLASPPPDYLNSPTSSIATCMVNKGYSHKLTNNVLSELNDRANEISMMINSPPESRSSEGSSGSSSSGNRSKRFSIIHRSRFNQMESISQHYSVHDSSSNKRRRTLNGKDEIVAIPILTNKEDEDQRKDSIRKISPVKMSSTKISPSKSPNKISPSKISPSKRSMNLHAQLNEKSIQVSDSGSPSKREFIRPTGVPKTRIGSLELSGVKSLQRKSSIPQLQDTHTLSKKPSIPQLQKKPSIPQLQKKPSIPQLQKKPSIPQLQKKPSIPQLQKKPSIPNLNKKPSTSQLYHSPSLASRVSSTTTASTTTTVTATTTTNLMPPPPPPPPPHSYTHSPSHKTISRKSSIPQLQKIPNLSRISPSKSLNHNVLHNSTNIPKSRSVTIPEPFSLYDKPTISSSQKSLNKFQRFKEKFS
ncbi:uncharacterized protein SPAPADRAFT_152410 [Spathaspora passalidarum NRRL Y-27907]|uniref:Uncharacterized protein n=1 Tax=Spathaspora passalidarum (strain NRRL Y-27907 / 11-Y1) TaxID=619300 RepID=G3AP12_SPAPN|nr:uncharacterized protein SPAPADRAFT_152410 [Spathaspora passalidarum NRRL Y-27907]EGW32042.1 hypothetical protein SPAPADRAFT_152410 [Spathaspora passalidarum NRRL Y-27907]